MRRYLLRRHQFYNYNNDLSSIIAPVLSLNLNLLYYYALLMMTSQIQIPLTSSVGSVVGQIRAVDADGGIHGQVKYQMISQHSLVSVDRNSGKVVIY